MIPELGNPAADQQEAEPETKRPIAPVGDAHFKLLIDLLPAAFYITDKDGYITHYNNAAKLLWGREPVMKHDKWCGSWKIYDADGQPLPQDQLPMAVALREGKVENGKEIVIERPDGTSRYVMPHLQLFYDEQGHVAGGLNMLVDITDQKKSEINLRELAQSLEKKIQDGTADISHKIEELRKTEERYQRMIEEVEDYAILLLDKEGLIENWNRGAEKIKGFKADEIVGKSFRVFYLPEDQEKGIPDKLIEEARNNGKALHEGWRLRKDGSVFWGSIVITAMHDDHNNVVGFSKVSRDLTERKTAEDKIRQYTNELEFQNKELEQFAYAAAHDMKEPLRKIRFYSNMVFDNSGHLLPDKEREYLSRSISAASRMQVLIDDLLTYSKTSTVNQELKKVDLAKIISDIQVSHADIIQDIRATIDVGELPIADGIPFQLMQLFDNLVSNALKYYAPKRKPHIVIRAEKVLTREPGANAADEPKAYHKISISDNGIGFDAQYADKVFDLFQRLHDKITYSGTGIGLTLCRKIVQNHKGFILAHGEEDVGATFSVYLPAKKLK